MLSPAVRRRPRGHRGRRPQPGDLRLARRLGVQHPRLRGDVPGATGRRRACRRTRSPSTGARTGGSSTSPTGWPRRCTTPRRRPPARRQAGRPRTASVTARVFETQREELAWLVEAVREVHGDPRRAAVVRHRRADPRQRARRRGLRRPDRRRHPGRDRRACPGCCGCPRWPRSWRCCTCSRTSRPTPSLLTLLTGPRWAIGPRDLKLLGDRARELAGVRGRAPDADVRSTTTWSPSPTASTRPRSRASTTRSNDPGDAAYSAGGARAVRAAGRRAADAALARRRAAARHRPADHRDHRRRRRAGLASASPAAVARRDNLDLFVRAVADFQAVDGDVTLVALLAYLTAEDEESKGLEVVAPVRGRLGQAAHRPPRQGPRVGGGVPGRRLRRPVPQQPVADPVDVVARRAARPRCEATRSTCRSCAATTRRRSTTYREDTKAHEKHRGAAARRTSPSPAPRTGCR